MNPQVPARSKLNGAAEEPWFVACDFGFADLRASTMNLVSDFCQEVIWPLRGAVMCQAKAVSRFLWETKNSSSQYMHCCQLPFR